MERSKSVRKSARSLAPWQIQRAIKLLSSCPGGCTVATAAQACGLSASHFAHAFKATTGVPPHRWLVLNRVQCARQMMESSSESLCAIAASCGFADQSHLSRVFRSVIGCSPAAWRRALRSGVSAAELEGMGAGSLG